MGQGPPAGEILLRCFHAALGRLELQAELHRGIEEALDRAERHHQAFRNAAERQADLEIDSSDTTRSPRNWCCRMMVISSGYCASQPRRQFDAVGFGEKR